MDKVDAVITAAGNLSGALDVLDEDITLPLYIQIAWNNLTAAVAELSCRDCKEYLNGCNGALQICKDFKHNG